MSSGIMDAENFQIGSVSTFSPYVLDLSRSVTYVAEPNMESITLWEDDYGHACHKTEQLRKVLKL